MNKNGVVLLLIFIFAGLCLMFTGRVMGADRTLYFGNGYRLEAVSGLVFRNSATSGEIVSVDKRQLPSFTEIDIRIVDMDIQFQPADNYGIELSYTADRDITWEVKKGKLIVKDNTEIFQQVTINANSRAYDSYAVVYCPTDKIDKIELNTVSGKIEIEGYHAKSIVAETVSGEITLRDCESDRQRVKTVSGGIRQENCGSDDIYLESVSGSIYHETEFQANLHNIRLSSVSGSMLVNGEPVSRSDYDNWGDRNAPYKLSAETVSGRIELWFND